jgi:hypothetical protein
MLIVAFLVDMACQAAQARPVRLVGTRPWNCFGRSPRRSSAERSGGTSLVASERLWLSFLPCREEAAPDDRRRAASEEM